MENQITALKKIYNHFSNDYPKMMRSLEMLRRSVAPDLDRHKVRRMFQTQAIIDGKFGMVDMIYGLEGRKFDFTLRDLSIDIAKSYPSYERVSGTIKNVKPLFDENVEPFSMDFYENVKTNNSFFSMDFDINTKESEYYYSTKVYDFGIFKGTDEEIIQRAKENGLRNLEHIVHYISRELDELFFEYRETILSDSLGLKRGTEKRQRFNDPFILRHRVSLDGEDFIVK
jgi:hypothetical protein